MNLMLYFRDKTLKITDRNRAYYNLFLYQNRNKNIDLLSTWKLYNVIFVLINNVAFSATVRRI